MFLNVNIVQRCSEHLKVTMFAKWNVQMECSNGMFPKCLRNIKT